MRQRKSEGAAAAATAPRRLCVIIKMRAAMLRAPLTQYDAAPTREDAARDSALCEAAREELCSAMRADAMLRGAKRYYAQSRCLRLPMFSVERLQMR